MFATIVQAVLDIRYRKGNGVPKGDILRTFKANEYWLMDAVEYPINNIDGKRASDDIRKGHINRGIPNLLERISTLRAENGDTDITIVLIKNLVYECLVQPLRQFGNSVGYSVPQDHPIGFPRYYGDPETIEGIRSVICP